MRQTASRTTAGEATLGIGSTIAIMRPSCCVLWIGGHSCYSNPEQGASESPEYGGLMPLDRDVLAESVHPVAEQLQRLAPQLLADSDSATAGSWIQEQLGSELNLLSDGNFPIVREALVAAMYATLSGVDHAMAWTMPHSKRGRDSLPGNHDSRCT